jgi:hypothetical protein
MNFSLGGNNFGIRSKMLRYSFLSHGIVRVQRYLFQQAVESLGLIIGVAADEQMPFVPYSNIDST